MFTMPKWPSPSFRHRKITSLDKIYMALEKLGNPHLKLPPVIHVAGTNGKGSSVAFLKYILEKSGYKVHTYTSPHLIYFNERIYLAGEHIDNDYLNKILSICKSTCESNNIDLTFFEGTTLAAFLAFSEIKADFLIMETGMGGRLDPTNVIETNLASLITPIAYDHTEYLGPTLSNIAAEKAGIIKDNRPCFLSLQTDEAFEVIQNRCLDTNSPLIAFGYDYGIEVSENSFKYKDSRVEWEFPKPALEGDHQIINAACVISLFSHMQIKNVTYESIKDGLTSVKWPGRLQKITSGKYARMVKNSNIEIRIDGAHNPHGAQSLAFWIEKYAKKPVNIILGMTNKRNVEAFLKPFKGLLENIYVVKVEDELLSATTEYLAAGALKAGFRAIEKESISEAIEEITVKYPDSTIIITGSLYLNSQVLYE